MYEFRAKSLKSAVRAAVLASAGLASIPALAADHVIFQRDNFTLNATLTAALYGVFADDVAFGGTNGQGESGSVNNFEYMVKPGINWTWDHGEAGTIYGAFSAPVAGNHGDGDPGGFTDGETDVIDVDDGYLGWRWDTFDISFGRQAFTVGDQFLIGNQVALTSKAYPAFWIFPTRAYDNTAIVRFNAAPVQGQLFWIETAPSQGSTEIGGLNVDYLLGEDGAGGKLGAMLAAVMDTNVAFSNRQDMKIGNIRANGVTFAQLPNFKLSGEYVFEQFKTANQAGTSKDASAWYVEGEYQFANVTWTPTLTYRYGEWQDGFDPLTYYFPSWGKWYQGEISGEYYLFQSNQDSHMAKLALTPLEGVTTSFQYFNHSFHKKSVSGTTSDDFADEFNFIVDWVPAEQWYLAGVFAYATPGRGGNEFLGGTDKDMILGEVYASWTW